MKYTDEDVRALVEAARVMLDRHIQICEGAGCRMWGIDGVGDALKPFQEKP